MASELVYLPKLPRGADPKTLLIYDRRLLKSWGPWIRRYPLSYGVKSGEELKDLRHFPDHVAALLKKTSGVSPKELTVLAFGGGSVGDFAGFFASVFKRGVRFEQIPSTWLAALDSAHGGKTALNVDTVKNQIGTFYSASKVYLVKEVLRELGPDRFHEAVAEAVKVALLDSEELSSRLRGLRKADQMWKFLPDLIQAKMKIVRHDPEEKKGLRHLLNLGHTMGHVIESELGLAHGIAVGHGIRFAMEWSARRHHFELSSWDVDLHGLIPSRPETARVLRRLRRIRPLLLQDKKKSSGNRLRFIFLKAAGKPRIEDVSVDEILGETERQIDELSL